LLGESLKQFVHHFGGDLIGAVEDDTQPAQRLGKILGRFGLTCTRRPRRTSPQLIRQGRCDGNPAPISQGRNNQSGGGPKILIPILQRRGNLLMSQDYIFLRSHCFPKLASHQPCTASPGLRSIFLNAAQSSPSCLPLKEFTVITHWIKSKTLGIIFSCFPSIAPASFRFSTMTTLSQLIEQGVWEFWPIC
jgi:hypothetical protein